MKRSLYIYIFLISVLLYVCCSIFRTSFIPILGLSGIFQATFIGYFIFTIYMLILLNKYGDRTKLWKIFLTVILGISIVEIPLRLYMWRDSLVSLGSLLGWYFGIIVAYLIYKFTRPVLKILTTILSTIIITWFVYIAYPAWIDAINFGTFSGSTEQVIEIPIVFQDSLETDIHLSSFKGKYLILDFWSTSCGACFSEFPKVQEVYESLSEAEDIELYSVLCRGSKETLQKGNDILQKRGYTFPSLSIDVKSPILKYIGVNVVPTVIIFDPKGKLIFRGNIKTAERYITNLMNN